MRITIVGAGYVGLVSAACFADFGHDVICVDKDEARVTALKHGRMPIFEPGLEKLVMRNASAGRLQFEQEIGPAVATADVVFIAVGTPSRRGDGHADLSHVYAAAREIGRSLTGYTVIATKSTVPVGTGDEVEVVLREAAPNARFDVVSNPEFLREGAAISDFKRPDRIVIGADSGAALAVMQEVYRPLFLNRSPVVAMGRRCAELTKYAANAFLATKITFINELADLCEAVGADVQNVAHGMGLDNRIGSKFLHAGPGYGGSCFPKDTLALLKTAQDHETPLRVVEAVASVNEARKRAMGRRIIRALGRDVRGSRVAILGLTFKPNTDDMRDSPAVAIVQALEDAGVRVSAYDPEGMEAARTYLPNVTMAGNAYEAAADADALAIVTEWDLFRALDLERLGAAMRHRRLIDLRNVYSRAAAEAAGFAYSAIGTGSPAVSASAGHAANVEPSAGRALAAAE
ncbi:UDP-glucose dehydrogenase family protein [Allosphingosinicella deserti]|uniref:UDP-glucose 6-dehydrogenase n=1 Tax=Allosphingosinicella deserti TaxID=2116704 RepID=A0A2P7QEI3_9SPHN|nr:UDP-glucose/GDP-mannose dehydrogenase family protein [Sphingomonas deserti]PSJ36383.1 UDP-glucose 6-dehydrogenase [Sphingomonas deserti]